MHTGDEQGSRDEKHNERVHRPSTHSSIRAEAPMCEYKCNERADEKKRCAAVSASQAMGVHTHTHTHIHIDIQRHRVSQYTHTHTYVHRFIGAYMFRYIAYVGHTTTNRPSALMDGWMEAMDAMDALNQ